MSDPVPESPESRVRKLWQGALGAEHDPGATIRLPSSSSGAPTLELTGASSSADRTLELTPENAGGDQTLVIPGTEPDTLVQHLTPDKSVAPSANATTIVSSSAAESFTLKEPVGKGGMGVIWRAEQNGLNRVVAVKLPLATNAGDPQFIAEAQVTGYLEHPNIVPVHVLGADSVTGQPYFGMKLVEGLNWKWLLHPETLPADRVAQRSEIEARAAKMDLEAHLKILIAVCNAVRFAHSKSIINRDLKPDNVIVGEFGEVLVMDWGIALDISEQAPTETRAPHRSKIEKCEGTPCYMPPEMALAEGDRQGPSTDVYLLGAILHEILTGRPPHTGSVDEALIKATIAEPPRFEITVPQELAGVCTRALAKEPPDRFQDAVTFQKAVEDYLKHRESAIIAAKADKEAAAGEIPNLARAVILYDQALELWPENAPAKEAVSTTRKVLTLRERRNRLALRGLGAAVATIVVGLLVGFFWINGLKNAETKAKEETKTQLLKTEEALVESRHQEGIAWLERAKQKKQERNDFAAALMAARAVGFDGYGRPEADKKFGERFPKLLRPNNAFVAEASDYADNVIGKPIWISPISEWPVRDVRFSPDGMTLASVSYDNILRLWDVATGIEKAQFGGGIRPGHGLCFSPDGTMLACGCDDNTIRLWDVATKTTKANFKGHELAVTSVCFSLDGTTLASSSMDQTIRLWEVSTGKEKAKLEGHEKAVLCMSFSPDGMMLASGSEDQTIRLWDVVSGYQKAELKVYRSYVTSLSFSPHGWQLIPVLASGSQDGTIHLWDLESGTERAKFKGHADIVTDVCFSPDGITLASASKDKTIRLWDVWTTTEMKAKLEGHADAVLSLSFSPDGTEIASGGADNTVRMWDVVTAKAKEIHRMFSKQFVICDSSMSVNLASYVPFFEIERNQVKLKDVPNGMPYICVNPNSHIGILQSGKSAEEINRLLCLRYMQALNENSARLMLSRLAPGRQRDEAQKEFDQRFDSRAEVALLELRHQKLQGEFNQRFNSKAEEALLESRHQEGIAWLERAKQELHIEHNNFAAALLAARAIGFTGYGRPINDKEFSDRFLNLLRPNSEFEAEAVALVDHAIGKPVWISPKNKVSVSCICFSPDGMTLALGCNDESILIWDVATGKQTTELHGHIGSISNMSFSPDGATLCWASNNIVRLWDVATGTERFKLSGHIRDISELSFSPDSKLLASGGEDQTVRLWNVSTGEQKAELAGHNGWITSLCFSPDGATLASASLDRTIRLWDVLKGGEKIKLVRDHPIESVSFSPDGRTLAFGDSAGTVEWRELAEAKVIAKFAVADSKIVCGVYFSPDGATLASQSDNENNDNTIVQFWDLATGKERMKIEAGNLSCVSFSPDGATMALGGGLEGVQLWDVAMGREKAIREINLASYIPYFEIERDRVRAKAILNGMPYLNVNPYSHIGILQSGKPPDEINRLLFWRYYQAMNKNSASLMLKRLPLGKERDEAQGAFDRRFNSKAEGRAKN